MRCQCVGANVSPMRVMLSPAMMLIKPALLSYQSTTKGRPSRAAPSSLVLTSMGREPGIHDERGAMSATGG
jgi:hypothetical protein